MSVLKIGINGFGRIGRLAFRAISKRANVEVVGINDLQDVEYIAYLLKYDSVHGTFPLDVKAENGHLVVDGKTIRITAEKDPNNLKWNEIGVDVVLECTGIFTTLEKAQAHLNAGAKKVVISAPSADAPMFVMGVNHKSVKPTDTIVSNASCTTNCLAPIAKVINGIIAVYALLEGLDLRKKSNLPILLAAPTGRAARRMNELTALPSATIHRHLGMTGDDDTSHLEDYLDADFIIVDEFSMVDTWLANQLFSNISSNSKILIVGDSDQLPSVSPGQVLADLLQIPLIPQTRLERIYRQSEESTIVTLASQIRQGILPADFTQKKADRSYFEIASGHIPATIEKILGAALRSGIPARDIQVLAPMYRGTAGIDAINQLMQDLLNPQQKGQVSFEATQCHYRTGDKVIHLVNDAEVNVFNGDLGYITDLIPGKYTESKQDEIVIDFDGNEVIYPRNEWYKIRLAYAMSIHKSQGSEFPVVILPITSASKRMLERNLIYTAITRAKSKLILLGELQAFDYAVKHIGTARKTYLIERFSDLIETNIEESKQAFSETTTASDSEQSYILTEENWSSIPAMIGITDADLKEIFGK